MTVTIDPRSQVYTNPTVATFTGRRVNPLDLNPDDIDPIDIAHSLSNQCRYTGHVKKFYSVAEHCVIIHDWLAKFHQPMSVLRWAILHDADEAYLVDLAAPIKHSIGGFGDKFKEVARAITESVVERFDLELPEPAIVKEIDVQLRETEITQLFPAHLDRPHDYGKALPITIKNWPPTEAKYEFLCRLDAHGIVKRNRRGEWVST